MTPLHVVRVPDAVGTDDVVLTDWMIAEGGRVTPSDAIAVLETAKAMVEVDAGHDGVVLRHLLDLGGTASAGAPLAVIGAPGTSWTDADLRLPGQSELAGPAQSGTAVAGSNVHQGGTPPVVERQFVSPIARRIAFRAELELGSVDGTGPGGRIRRVDVERALAVRPGPAGLEANPSGRAGQPVLEAVMAKGVPNCLEPEKAAEPVKPARPGIERVPHGATRRVIARRLSASKATVPHFYIGGLARVDALLDLHRRVAEAAPVKVTITDLVLKAMARAHRAVPDMNVIWTDLAIEKHDDIDICLAIACERGVVAGVIRDVEGSSVASVARRRAELVERARSNRLAPADLDGGTSTLTNLGGLGVREFSAIIIPPQSSILAIGSILREPVVVGKKVKAAAVLHLGLSIDHRPIDGVVAGEWMRELVSALESPLTLLV